MSKIDWSQIKPIPGFDSLKWKRENQARIYEETKNMTSEQRRERERRASERMQREREQYWAEQAALAEIADASPFPAVLGKSTLVGGG